MNNNLSIYKSKVTFLYYIIFSSIVHFYIFISYNKAKRVSTILHISVIRKKMLSQNVFIFKMLIMRQFPYSTVQRERERDCV